MIITILKYQFIYFLRFLILLMLFFDGHHLFPQATFQKTLGTEDNDIGSGVIIRENGDLLIVMTTTFPDEENADASDNDVVLCNTNSNGEVLSSSRLLMNGNQEAKSTIATFDGGFLIAGTTSQENTRKCFLIKLNSSLTIQWTKEFTWQYGNRFHFIKEDENENIYLGLDCFSENGNYPDDILIKMDDQGNMLWKRSWGIDNNDHISDLHFLNNGNFVAAFSIWFPGADMVFICLNPSGEIIWQKCFFEDHNYYPRNFIDLGNGECILVGRVSPAPEYSFAIKFDADFSVLWKKLIMPSEYELLAGSGIKINDKIYFNANIVGFNGGDIGLICMDLNGNINWINCFGGSQTDEYPALSASSITGNENGIYLTGATKSFGQGESDAYLIKTNLNGISGCNETELSFQTANMQYEPRDVNIDLNFNIEVIDINIQSSPNDEIALTIICSSQLEANFTSNFQIACAGDSINFTDLSMVNPTSWQWTFEGGNPPTSLEQNPENIQYSNPGFYDVTLIVSDGDTQDTIIKEDYIQILPFPSINFGNDTIICFDQLLTLDVGVGFDNILWQDGSQGQSFLVSEPGTYWVEVSNLCGAGGDTITVDFSEPFYIWLGNDTSFCFGQSYFLDAGEGFESYLWNDGSISQTNQVSSGGYHWAEVTDSLGCTAVDSVFVDVYNDFEISIGDDSTRICEGEYIFITGPDGYQNYLWQDGSDYPSILADTAGTYWLEVTDENGCAARDSMVLVVNIIPENLLGNDTIICPETEITIQAAPGYSNYVWHDGSASSTFTTDHEGIFWLTVQDEIGCTGSDTITITNFEIPGLGMAAEELICPDDTLLLDAGQGYLSYLWSDGSQNQTLQVSQAGFYNVEVETVCGLYSDTVEIKLYNGNLDLGNDTILCDGEILLLNPGNGYSNFYWSNGSADSTLMVGEPGNYWLKAFDGFCTITDTIVIDACAEIKIHNVFTPNGDLYNETFYAVTLNPGGIVNFKMVIFNRWGRIVKTLNRIDEEWDGKINNSKAAEGVYFWVCDYSAPDKTGKINFHSKQGSVTLMR